MQKIEQILDSVEVAGMIEKEHKFLMRDIRGYIEKLYECKIEPVDFFMKSSYVDAKGETRPCYRITRKGCEFIANKLTGTKGVRFTARYINRFHEMQDILSKKEVEPEIPWFIRKFRGHYVMLFRDFEAITGINPIGRITKQLEGGRDYNGWAWYTTINKKEFLKKYGFDYGDDNCMMYFYLRGIEKAMSLCRIDNKLQMEKSAYDTIMNGLKEVQPPKKIKMKRAQTVAIDGGYGQELPMQVNIIFGGGEKIV